MIFSQLKIPGTFLIEPEKSADERGFFARVFCEEEFQKRGLETRWPQASVSFNAKASTLRGLHFQIAPHPETKLVRCTRGAVYDVIVDLRRDSPAWKSWCAVELSSRNYRTLYIPAGCAHGFLTLQDESELSYHISGEYRPESARGVRYDDAAFGIEWPFAPVVIAEKDRAFPDYDSQIEA